VTKLASFVPAPVRTVWDQAHKRVFLLWDLLREVPWRKLRKLHDRNATTVVWIHHRYPASWAHWILREDTILKDLALAVGLAEAGVPFRVVGGRKIEAVHGARVVWTIHPYNPDRNPNYAEGMLGAVRRIEDAGNELFPSSEEAQWWENKVFMHTRFDELGVPSPRTVIDRPSADLSLTCADGSELGFPLLVKEPHSQGSAGLHKVESIEALRRLRADLLRQGESELLLQELIDMGRDLRATLVGDRVVHHYFRINTTDEWQPTSTRRGSQVDFVTFPEQWRQRIVDVFRSTGLRTGAFDICWRGDDLDTEPLFLEVSPSYTPNPPPSAGFVDRPYYEFKKQLTGPDSFGTAFVRTVFDIQAQVLDEWGITRDRP
jgi:hypothetical protein